jgi:hypothetical protein
VEVRDDQGKSLSSKVHTLDKGEETKRFDNLLRGLYPLTAPEHLSSIPTQSLINARQKEDALLKRARAGFVSALLHPVSGYSLGVNPQKDFSPPPPPLAQDTTMALFRQWVQNQQRAMDESFLKQAKGIEIDFQKSKLLDPSVKGLRWMKDMRVNGYIESSKDRRRVLYRLLLRREILGAVARTRAEVRRIKPRADRRGEQTVVEPRRIGRVLSLRFLDERGRKRTGPRLPYAPNRIEIKVSCHLGVVSALLRELETIGGRNGARQRAFAFWADELVIKRPAHWPTVSMAGTEVNSERLAEYGRYLEWPVTALITGTVPEFRQELDPEPRSGRRKK